MRILITSGGNRESIDGVRYLTNFSTGNTGAFLADSFSEEGHTVCHLSSQTAVQSSLAALVENFEDFEDLKIKLEKKIKDFKPNVIVHLAAVSDFKIKSVSVDGKPIETKTKLPSNQEVTLTLTPNPKLIDDIPTWVPENKPILVAFKLTRGKDPSEERESIEKLFKNPHIHFVVHNRLEDVEGEKHIFNIHDPSGIVVSGKTKFELAKALHLLTFKESV